MTSFNELPQEIKEAIKFDLGMYDETHVTFENGRYVVSPNIVLRNHYSNDFKFIGTYKAKEIFTRDEHITAEIMAYGYSPTYGIVFYPNKNMWSDNERAFESVRDAFIQKEIKSYVDMFGCEPSQEWIDMH